MTDLPIGWEIRTLSDVATWGSGGTPQSGNTLYYGGDIPWAIIGDLNDGVVHRTEKTITEDGLANSSAKMVPAGAILIAMYGSIGKMGIAKVPMATNQAIAFAIPNVGQILPEYLFWFLRSQREIFLSKGKGATQQNISQTLLKSWQIPIPPIEEQKSIVEALTAHMARLDKTFADLERANSRAINLKRSLLNELTSPRANELGEGRLAVSYWASLTLGDLGKWVTGSTPSSSDPANNGDEVLFVTPGDIGNGGKLSLVARRISNEGANKVRRIQPGSVLLVCIGTIGKVAWTDLEITTNQQINALEVDQSKFDIRFVHWLLASPGLQELLWQNSTSTTVALINKKALEKIQCSLPPLDEQRRILETLDQSISRLEAAQFSITHQQRSLQTLRRTLLNKAFTGELGTI